MFKKEEFFDLRILKLGAADLAAEILLSEQETDADLVVVDNPTQEQISELCDHGYFLKPTSVNYELSLPAKCSKVEDYVATLAPRIRTKCRSASRRFDDIISSGRGELTSDEGEHPERLSEFVDLYTTVISELPRGRILLPAKIAQRGGLDSYCEQISFALYFRVEGVLCGGVIVNEVENTYSIDYTATDVKHDRRLKDLQLYFVLQVVMRSISEGRSAVGYGSDTNLYGHHLGIGLMEFKLRLGFRPTPGRSEQIVKFLDLSKFREPVVFFTGNAPMSATILVENDQSPKVQRVLKDASLASSFVQARFA